jgi:chromosome partitioning protein
MHRGFAFGGYVSAFEKRIGIIANRVRANMRVSHSLTRFLNSLDIPLIATLRDAQSYVRSAEIGLGVYEMPRWQVQQDLPQWHDVLSWLAARRRGQSAAAPSPSRLSPLERPSSEPDRSPLVPAAMLVSAAPE